MTKPQVGTYFPVRIKLINRKTEMRMIMEAINSKKPSAIFFTGEGGIGKTRLLEEIFDQRELLGTRGIRCSDLIDLYHPVNHSPDNVQFHIAQQIDPQNRFFQDYHSKRAAFLSAEEKGVARGKLTELAKKRDNQFLEDYQALTEQGRARVLLIFDTTEQIQHESDVVQALFGMQAENLAIHNWLTSRAPLLPNTVILLAGRPKPEVEGQIQSGFVTGGWTFQKPNLETLEYKDAIEYIDALLQDMPLPEALTFEEKDWIIEITGGKPIRLALVLQFIYYRGIGELRARVEREGALDKILIEHLIDLPGEYGEAMHYMLLARNGMDPALLAHLTRWTEARIRGFFQDMQRNVLFKARDGIIFLHDELYDLHDLYYRDDPKTQRVYATLAGYYQGLLKQERPYRERLELYLQLLFYEMQAHFEQGYQLFSALDEEVIWLHIKSVDLRLRDEMLKFINRYLRAGARFFDARLAEQVDLEIIDTDNAIRCIEREIADSNFGRALSMGDTILNTSERMFADRLARDPLYKARIQYGCAEAVQYVGESDVAQKRLEEVVRLLEGYQPQTEAQKYWKARTLGRAHNRFGYSHRVNGHFAKSIPAYRKAVTEFRKANLDYMLAQTLNNLAYILALTGDNPTAFEHVQDALKIISRYGLSYRRLLILRCLSRVLVEGNRPLAARKELEEAAAIANQLEDTSAVMKIKISDGRALRKLGNLWKDTLAMYPKKEADAYFQLGEKTLVEALEALDLMGEKAETLDRWETHNELSSLYCDWAWLHLSTGNRVLASTCYYNAIKYQEEALKIVRQKGMLFQILDSLDDLAQAHGDRALFWLSEQRRTEAQNEKKEAEQTLAEAEELLPEPYRRFGKTGSLSTGALKITRPAADTDTEDGAPYWLVLAKANLWRGIWQLRWLEYENQLSLESHSPDIEQAFEYLLKSQVFFKRYGENSDQIDRSMRYLSRFVGLLNTTYDWMEAQIVKVEKKYNTTLPLVRTRMQNKLGF